MAVVASDDAAPAEWSIPFRAPATGAECRLRSMRPDDRTAYFASIDREVRDRQGYNRRFVALQKRAWRPGRELPNRPGHTQVAVEHDGRFAGVYSLGPQPVAGVERLTLGWWLAREARGQGLGRASLAALLPYLHDEVRLPTLWMGTNEDNQRTIAQIESTGARLALQEPHKLPNGQTVAGRWYVHGEYPETY